MAEVLGLVAAIGGIIASGFQAAQTHSTIAEDLGTAGAQIQAIAAETEAISWSLCQLKEHLEETKQITSNAVNTINHTVAQCKKTIDDIKEHLAPVLARKTEDMVLKQRVRWLFAKHKVSTKQASLDSIKLSLTLILSVLCFREKNYIEDYIQVEIKRLVSKSENVKKSFVDAERTDQAIEKAYETLTNISPFTMSDNADFEVDSLPQTSCSASENVVKFDNDTSNSTSSERALESQIGDTNLAKEGFELVPRSQSHLNQTNSDIDLLDRITDDQIMVIADHVRLQRATRSFARVAMEWKHKREHGVPSISTAENNTGTAHSEEINPAWSTESSAEARENTTAEPKFTVPPSAKFPGTQATFDSSSYTQNVPRAPFEATAGNSTPSNNTYWRMPEYSSPHSQPNHDYSYSPQPGSYRGSQMPSVHDVEKIRLQEELACLRSDRARKEEEEKNRQKEKVRQAAEDAIARRIEDEKRAKADIMREQEVKALKDAHDKFKADTEARKEAHDKEQAEAKARKDADAAAAAAKEAEDRLVNEVRSRTEAEIRNKFEEERKAEQETKRRSGLQKLFSWK
ncbi:hypothetical protein CGCSCA1_v001015 [Colletotrichum siamense]|nr:hypothetical protein CGCSCA1_v001015 [Colletotrichum siamense]